MAAGQQLGAALANAGIRLVYGGGTKGIMGAVATGVLEGGGKVTGIIPRFLIRKEAGESRFGEPDELIVTDDMHQRKHAMFERSDAFVALPGGIGTVEEIIEVMTWAQLGHHRKPMVFANIEGFWDPMRVLIEHMRAEGFIHTGHLVQPLIVNTVAEIVPTITEHARMIAESTGDSAIIDKL
jgi:uncharacterized protein (TIGR00730 family)